MSTNVRLDDDTYCYASVAGGVRSVHIVNASRESPAEQQKSKTPAKIPDFLSGAVNFALILPADTKNKLPKTMEHFHPTDSCAKIFKLIPDEYQNVARLAVEPLKGIADLTNPDSESDVLWAMYHNQKPTLYTGLMRQVVQALLGFGQQKTKTDSKGNKTETSYYDTTKPVVDSDLPQTPNKQFNTDVLKNGLQVPYDFHFAVSHGIALGSDGEWWVVEVGLTRGVLAMPLSINPATALPEFRTKLQKLGDTDGLTMLDTFGGFPTGEPMPDSDHLDSWVRAGRVLKLLSADDLDPFYGNGNQAFGPSMGWAWNASGNAAVNTCFNYIGNTAISYLYELTTSIGASKAFDVTKKTKSLKQAFEKLRQTGNNKNIVDAAIWKLDRLGSDDFNTATKTITQQGAAAALVFVDSLVLPPLATGSSHLSLSDSGYFYFQAKIGPQIKFPNMALGYVVSTPFNLLFGDLPTVGHSQKCDTIMFAYFQGDALKVVKYYYDPRAKSAPAETDDFETCMFQGTWHQHTDNGKSMGPMFYTSDLDDRAEFAGTASDTKIVGTSMGYSQVSVADDIIDPVFGNATRQKRYRKCTTTTSVAGEAGISAIVIPFFDREAYYYAYGHSTTGTSASFGCGYVTLLDPWSCPTWRNFPGFTGHFVGDITTGHWVSLAQHPDGCGPVTDRTAMHPSPVYSPSTCSDLADSGPWCHICDDLDRMTYFLTAPPLPASTNVNSLGTATRKVVLVSSEKWGQIVAYNGPGSFGRWGLPSPDSDGTTDYAEETQNVLGGIDCIRASGGITAGDPGTILKGLDWPGLTQSVLTFIGVVS